MFKSPDLFTDIPTNTALFRGMSGKIMLPDAHVLTLSEVASLLRVPKSTVYKLAQNAKLPGFKVGKHWRFLLSDIEGWLKNRGASELESDKQRSEDFFLTSGGERRG